VTNQVKAAVQKFHVMLFDFPFVFQTKGEGRKSFVFRPKLSRFFGAFRREATAAQLVSILCMSTLASGHKGTSSKIFALHSKNNDTRNYQQRQFNAEYSLNR